MIGSTLWPTSSKAFPVTLSPDCGPESLIVKKIKLLLFLAAFLAEGCSSVTGTRVAPDGSRLFITAHRALWVSENIQFTLKDASGIEVGLSVGKSRPDQQSVQSVAAGVAAGVVQGLK